VAHYQVKSVALYEKDVAAVQSLIFEASQKAKADKFSFGLVAR
jgi:hypothetical protein